MNKERKEEILTAAEKFRRKFHGNASYMGENDYFLAGAKWADGHPRKDIVAFMTDGRKHCIVLSTRVLCIIIVLFVIWLVCALFVAYNIFNFSL